MKFELGGLTFAYPDILAVGMPDFAGRAHPLPDFHVHQLSNTGIKRET